MEVDLSNKVNISSSVFEIDGPLDLDDLSIFLSFRVWKASTLYFCAPLSQGRLDPS